MLQSTSIVEKEKFEINALNWRGIIHLKRTTHHANSNAFIIELRQCPRMKLLT